VQWSCQRQSTAALSPTPKSLNVKLARRLRNRQNWSAQWSNASWQRIEASRSCDEKEQVVAHRLERANRANDILRIHVIDKSTGIGLCSSLALQIEASASEGGDQSG